jgi:hypothetical protein
VGSLERDESFELAGGAAGDVVDHPYGDDCGGESAVTERLRQRVCHAGGVERAADAHKHVGSSGCLGDLILDDMWLSGQD